MLCVLSVSGGERELNIIWGHLLTMALAIHQNHWEMQAFYALP